MIHESVPRGRSRRLFWKNFGGAGEFAGPRAKTKGGTVINGEIVKMVQIKEEISK
jgi:hypothetical protein